MNERGKNILIIVESPAKARTLERYLGTGYKVLASVGHVRDLPQKGLGVDVQRGFEPEYVIGDRSASVIADLRRAAKQADAVLLATDPDREGEAIAWHVVEALCEKNRPLRQKMRRITFNEVTKQAVLHAVTQPGEMDMDRVDAQQARRILDRLVGYEVSPLLWKKIKSGLSAGRVQSVAVRLLVDRERERRAFRIGTHWDVRAHLAVEEGQFTADLISVREGRIATGKDLDPRTGALKAGSRAVLLNQKGAEALCASLAGETFVVSDVEEKRSPRRPYPPFTTSTLQQEANNKLRYGARRTMGIAQRLYEAGRITYMRTDSVTISEEAVAAVRGRIKARYGDRYLSSSPRRYKTKSTSAQEAHEAVRPAGTEMPTARELGLGGEEAKLYGLIWKRTMASQMADGRDRNVTAHIEAAEARFRARGKTVEFDGFRRAYAEGSDDPDAALAGRESLLPPLGQGQKADCRKLEPRSHETKPPARFTEATLVKELEAAGVGRPSTYASIISTVLDRGYAERKGRQLTPTYTAIAVTDLLSGHFPNLVDTGFTSAMESQLDEIARGELDWRRYLHEFYHGDDEQAPDGETVPDGQTAPDDGSAPNGASKGPPPLDPPSVPATKPLGGDAKSSGGDGEGGENPGLREQLRRGMAAIEPREASTVRLPDLSPAIRIGRYGPYLELERYGELLRAPLPEDVAPADLSEEEALAELEKRSEGPQELGDDPDTGEPIYVLDGPYGPYVQLGRPVKGRRDKPKRCSLPEKLSPGDVTLEIAVKLLAMPSALGQHPDSGKPVEVGVGRYGPYVRHAGEYRSLEASDDVTEVTLTRALELLAMPKGRGRGIEPIRTVGPHPEDGEPIELFKGRYGPYVKHGKSNASVPKGVEPETVTVEMAADYIEARKQRGGGRKGGRGPRKSSPRKRKPPPKK